MLAWVLATADRDPSFMIGGITGNFGSNFRLGDGDQFVIEGDEYDTAYFDKVPKFWHYRPHRATINNIEFDHADIYPDVEEIEMVFRRFVDMIPEDGSLWVNGDDPRAMEVSEDCTGTRKTFGIGSANDLYAHKITYGDMTVCEVVHDGRSLGEFALPCMGEFNLRNMLGATGIALDEGIDLDDIKKAMRTFQSVKKRQELVGEVDGITVFDDFAHHPTAVHATVKALRNRFPDRRIWTIFEAKSNTSRRRVFQDDYPPAFESADIVVLSKPFQKKDSLGPDERLDIDQLAEQIRDLGPETVLIPDVDDIVDYVGKHAEDGDVIAGLSGSAFGGLHQKIVDRLRTRLSD
jgi:UDP-N-acetylmuramate: L-alanyl-gamma-D-glutamyl-meso-diaminopimelate ligase